ncbi:MAG TPA: SET domain-containing protein-lysine N-methyltransferase [Candidatus Methylomirabilis sp.]|nr:SET domain-containing protein-lysine N-methyltransferase [Candidatus Methylomirabilis sp.]
MKSCITPKAEVRKNFAGHGVFAKEAIAEGEIVADFSHGTGQHVKSEEADKLYEQGFDYMLQTGEDEFFAATTTEELEEGDYLNHSCDPNLGFHGTLRLVAMRDIATNEELTFDYAMSESSDYRMDCRCGAPNCRQVITGDDWKRPDLQKKFDGYFSEYLQRKIRAVHAVRSATLT